MRRLAWLALALSALSHAHEITHAISPATALTITLTYADGKPFAYEKYALYAVGSDTPRQVGNTDAAGRIVFVPDGVSQWRLIAASADGHGVNLEFASVEQTSGPVAGDCERLPRGVAIGVGFAILFGIFGLAQLFAKGRKNGPPSP